ncbi:MAG: nitrous oxide reductase family maturation protein NosD [Candidatus Kapabacteria bacterium]|nr:nitrous oxide reductase family maturation protein NosD [Candidatus Kapabacteria bacterium]
MHRAYPGGENTLRHLLSVAANGDTIRVMPGVHRGHTFDIRTSITLLGQPGAVIDAASTGSSILLVNADDVAIRNLTIRNVAVSYVDDNAAIKVIQRQRVAITNCRIENGFFAIYLSKSSNCRVTGNTIIGTERDESNSGNGIHAWTCRDILVSDNSVSGHRDGIYFEFMRHGTVMRNHSWRNARYGLHFMFSDSCSYKTNTFEYNGAGVAVMYSKWIEMFDNNFQHNWGPTSYGLLLKDITDGHLRGNRFVHNSVAIHGEQASRILMHNNTFVRNGYGLRILGGCELNTITNNAFDGNTFDVTTGTRESNNLFRENYWSAYDGYDLDRDGYGDVPYHPVRLYALLVEQMPSAVILMHTAFITILDLTERIIPTMTPETLVDSKPLMRPSTMQP